LRKNDVWPRNKKVRRSTAFERPQGNERRPNSRGGFPVAVKLHLRALDSGPRVGIDHLGSIGLKIPGGRAAISLTEQQAGQFLNRLMKNGGLILSAGDKPGSHPQEQEGRPPHR
jgi:hypothetical protein